MVLDYERGVGPISLRVTGSPADVQGDMKDILKKRHQKNKNKKKGVFCN